MDALEPNFFSPQMVKNAVFNRLSPFWWTLPDIHGQNKQHPYATQNGTQLSIAPSLFHDCFWLLWKLLTLFSPDVWQLLWPHLSVGLGRADWTDDWCSQSNEHQSADTMAREHLYVEFLQCCASAGSTYGSITKPRGFTDTNLTSYKKREQQRLVRRVKAKV